ncbi:hypothetical protein ACSBR2_031816 [Camellia fascicularis]
MVDDDIDNCNANTKEKEEFWSQLPFLLLWMIKDRLDFIDNVQLSAVCRHWWSASASYPKRLQSAGDRLPWIMQFSRNNFVKSSLREFICVSRRKKFTIDLPEFCNADTLFSKQGWLLLHRRNFSSDGRGENRRLPDSVFLINPFTKAKIEMPDVVSAARAQFVGSFSTTIEGYPHCVVLRECNRHRPELTLLRIAYAGADKMWSQHSFVSQREHFTMFSVSGGVHCDIFNGLLIIGQHVYCFNTMGVIIDYGIETHVWKEMLQPPEMVYCSIMEYEGEIIRVDIEDDYHIGGSLTFFRYNGTSSMWEKLNNNEVKGIIWFLQGGCYCFSARAKDLHLKKKAYVLYHNRSMDVDVEVLDLADGSTQMLLPFSCHRSAAWVDMG